MIDLEEWLRRADEAFDVYMARDEPDIKNVAELADLVNEMRNFLRPHSELEGE